MQLARWWSLNNAENSSDFAFLGKMGRANREVDGRPRSLPPPTTGVVVEGWSIRRCTRPWHVPEHPAVSLGGQTGDPLGRAARPDRRPGGGRGGEARRVVARLVEAGPT